MEERKEQIKNFMNFMNSNNFTIMSSKIINKSIPQNNFIYAHFPEISSNSAGTWCKITNRFLPTFLTLY